MHDDQVHLTKSASTTSVVLSRTQTQGKPISQSIDYVMSTKRDRDALRKIGHGAKKGAKATGMVAACAVGLTACVALFFICIPMM